MRVVVFGANGPTGRLLTAQALAQGHQVVAVTRNPAAVRPRDGLAVASADIRDRDAVEEAVAGGQAVVSVAGVSYSSKPISTYSTGTANLIAAMSRHGLKRLVVASSAAIDPAYRPSDSFLFTRIVEPYFMRKPGRTLYEDTIRMESLVRASDVDWTIVRSAWLFDSDTVTDYRVSENFPGGMYAGRSDLAASMVAQLADDRYVRRTVGVHTVEGTPSLIRQIWREGIRKPQKQ
ncbi:NAD(P)-dependent oxidoreductase [Nonomuraea aurantiaca]|uniref:NAD(P)-dependent oxidoreductase n=1 Tax=Nonomuraea aurantiaca TaxID=2878562 RepID=UPI001CD9C2EB|nr:NAD(P)H-binding protein [Nonomuraea aurantiaca]MCA2229516.1 NAD(P)H-binding protein [Nonomuraea aurantiaca]